jgi:endoglucanase
LKGGENSLQTWVWIVILHSEIRKKHRKKRGGKQMNINKKAALLCVMIVILIMAMVPLQSNASTPALHVEGNKIKDSSGNVAILRGISMIDIGAEEKLYGGILKNIDRLTNKNDAAGSSPGWYPKVLRIPVIPYDSGFQSPVPFKVGDDTLYNTLLRPAIDYCKQKDVYVILDWHYIDNTSSHVQTTNDFWRYMAPKFANDTNVLFELYNEPIDGNNWSSVRTNMQNWYNIVRAAAPNNLILVGTPNWCQTLTPVISNPISGTNIVYVTHVYCTHWYAGFPKTEVDALYKVYPIIMTEWGFSQSNESPGSIAYGSISDYGQPLMDFIEARGISNTAWCANYEWGPPMFWKDWTLRIGAGEMGGFVKDQLYKMRNNSTPGGFGNISTPTPTPTLRSTVTPTRGGTSTPTPTPGRGTISIAAGRTSALGSFQADQYYSGGSTYSNTNTVDVSQITSNPPPAALFNNERYGAMSYTIPGFTAGNLYAVTLYFAETYLTASGRRIFNVSINGATVLSNFDIYASAGGQNKAIARSYTATANSSGQIVIQFISGTENPKINGISINPGGNNPTPTPTPTRRGPTPTNTPTPTPTRRGPTPTYTPTPTRGNTPTPTPTTRAGGYVVTYTLSDWGGAANADVIIKNNSANAVNGWTLAWTFPGNQKITNMWNAAYTQSGASVSATNLGYNNIIAANGGTVSFGFSMTYTGTNLKPTAFTLNGAACITQ